MEKQTIDVIIGQKVEGEVDPSQIAPNTEAPADEVEGHSHYEYLRCPYTGEIFPYVISDDVFLYYSCKGCGRTFRK